jgi:hypothetical protein
MAPNLNMVREQAGANRLRSLSTRLSRRPRSASRCYLPTRGNACVKAARAGSTEE